MVRNALKKRVGVAAKREKADVVIKNGKIIDVFNQEIMEADVAISGGVFAGIGNYEGKEEIDAKGKYVSPGFIDGHVHIESAMVTPSEFTNVVLPYGVTSIVSDPHEIANVSGVDGIKFMMDASEGLPLHVFFALPSCVPATPFENAGAELASSDLRPLYHHDRVVSLGEVMDFPAVLHAEDDMVTKLLDAKEANRVIDGHASGVDEDGINVYMASGIHSDHECTTAQEAKERLERGMYVMLREGSASRDLKALLGAVNEKNARRCLFVTDDKALDDILSEGTIDHNVRVTVDHGINPVTAIQMASLNAAECFGMKTKGAIAPGYDADFILFDDLDDIHVTDVYTNGELVARDGECVNQHTNKVKPKDKLTNSIQMSDVHQADLAIRLKEDHHANIISIIPNSIVTKHKKDTVDVRDGEFIPSLKKDYLKLAVIERHNKKGNVGLGILHGLGITSGAIASTFAHDSHNVITVGTNDSDMLTAMKEIKAMNGGLAIINNGEVLASLSLSISGLLSDEDFQSVNKHLEELGEALALIGFKGDFNPFITLSFMALPVIPEIKLTDVGLFDVEQFKHISI